MGSTYIVNDGPWTIFKVDEVPDIWRGLDILLVELERLDRSHLRGNNLHWHIKSLRLLLEVRGLGKCSVFKASSLGASSFGRDDSLFALVVLGWRHGGVGERERVEEREREGERERE